MNTDNRQLPRCRGQQQSPIGVSDWWIGTVSFSGLSHWPVRQAAGGVATTSTR